MQVRNLIEKYKRESLEWADEINVGLQYRHQLFQRHFEEFCHLAQLKLSDGDPELAEFLYFDFWFFGENLAFSNDIEKARNSNGLSFWRLKLILEESNISALDAEFIADGIATNPFLRVTAFAIISEFCRKSRTTLAMAMGVPIDFGSYNLIIAALKPTPDELALYSHLLENKLSEEHEKPFVGCQMGSCLTEATWLVVCTHGDGKEFLCDDHKKANDLSFSTYKLIFSNSCGHHVERRTCSYFRVN